MRHLIKFHLLTVICYLLLIHSAGSQGLAIGDWRDHLPYNKTISIAKAGNKIYAATPYCVFYIDKDDMSVNRLNKINGLNDVGVTSVSSSEPYNTVVVTYENANIDLIQGNSIINIPDIKRKQILGNKTINKSIVNERYAYLCCGFGIVVLDLLKDEIKDTWYIADEGAAINCFDITFSPDSIFVATESGIYKASRTHPNLSNFSAWEKDYSIKYPDLKYNIIEYFKGSLIANYSSTIFNADTMFIYDGHSWKYFNSSNTANRHNINAFGDYLVIANIGFIDLLDKDLQTIGHTFTYLLNNKELGPLPRDAYYDEEKYLWIADEYYGVIQNWNEWSFLQYLPDGPNVQSVYKMASEGNILVSVPGGRDETWTNIWTSGSVQIFKNEHWTNLDKTTNLLFEPVRDVLSVEVDPREPERFYAGSWGGGLLEIYNDDIAIVWDTSNSSLRPPFGSTSSEVRIGGIKFDSDHNLWMSNSNASNLIAVKESSGNWRSYYTGYLAPGAAGIDAGDLIIDAVGQKWILLRGCKILVFNDNYTLDNTTDDHAVILTSTAGNGALPGTRVFSIAADKEGLVWVGTDEGVAVFYTPENIFSTENFDAQRIFIQQDGYTQYLLESEAVTAIAVDGANRKWFGTERAGVFLMSADGTKQICHFTAENSPLLSNMITCIEINDVTGEVFFGTDKGIVSYKGTATEGGETNSSVLVYPNPVEPEYSGPIAVKGLVKDADVKITDIAGNLVYHTKAEGGQAIWNCKTMEGKRPGSGVYLVFISNEDGTETYVTKILFKK